jgi:hypothetical protein
LSGGWGIFRVKNVIAMPAKSFQVCVSIVEYSPILFYSFSKPFVSVVVRKVVSYIIFLPLFIYVFIYVFIKQFTGQFRNNHYAKNRTSTKKKGNNQRHLIFFPYEARIPYNKYLSYSSYLRLNSEIHS